jgi:hypothetical protein
MGQAVAQLAAKSGDIRIAAGADIAAAGAEQRFGARTKLANHPLLGAFTAHEWRRFHLVHTRHHVKQITARRQAAAGR